MFSFHVTWFSFIMHCLSGETPGEFSPLAIFQIAIHPFLRFDRTEEFRRLRTATMGFTPGPQFPFSRKREPKKLNLALCGLTSARFYFPAIISSIKSRSSIWYFTPLIS